MDGRRDLSWRLGHFDHGLAVFRDRVVHGQGHRHAAANHRLALDAALAGEGVAIGDSLLAFPDLEAGRLVKPFDLTLATGAYYFLSPETESEPEKLTAFREWLLAEAETQARASARWA